MSETTPGPLHDLELLLRSHYGLIFLRTIEEDRAASLLRHVADAGGLPFFSWTRSQGIVREGASGGAIYDTKELNKALRHVAAAPIDALYHFLGLGADALKDDLTASTLRDAARALEQRVGGMVITGEVEAPRVVEGMAADLSLPGPTDHELKVLLARVVLDLHKRSPVDVDLSEEEKGALLRHLRGLTLLEASKILTKAILADGKLSADDVKHIVSAKKEVIEREGLLEYYPTELALAAVADLATLKDWLAKRKGAVLQPGRAASFGLEFPKGMLLLGVPGCGKSLSAKAVASEWGLPLLKLDPSNLYNKYVGESERNFKRAMQAAERMAPVVLWIDELEKAFGAGGSEDGGVSQRILGTFLSWLQDRRGDVFVVATANDVTRLPPEFLRKGRFDEIFFVDLPDGGTRREVFRIHLSSRNQDPETFDLDELAVATAGFSGAEIEGAVVAALYSAFAANATLTTASVLDEVRRTRPLSVTRAEEISALRAWARERTVSAN
jgi:hypothetical protein